MRFGGAGHWAAPFVLAMLCLRAFIPVGFMLAPVDGRLAVVLCDTATTGALHHHQHPSDHAAGHHHAQTDPTCPYAQSSGSAPLPSLPDLTPVRIATVTAAPVRIAQVHSQFGPARQQSPRGPPLPA